MRLLPDECSDEYDYLVSCDQDGSFRFSTQPNDAMLFLTWEAFVDAAQALWRSGGPMDIMYERVYTISREAARDAG